MGQRHRRYVKIWCIASCMAGECRGVPIAGICDMEKCIILFCLQNVKKTLIFMVINLI